MKLIRADPLLARRDEMNRLQPYIQLDVAVLKHSVDRDTEGLAASALTALVETDPRGLAAQLDRVADHAALGADRAVRPELRFHELVCRFFVVEVRGGEDRV